MSRVAMKHRRLLSAVVFSLMFVPPLLAQGKTVPCPAPGQELPVVPEIARNDQTGVLSGTLSTIGRLVTMAVRNPPGGLGTPPTCYEQRVRAYIPGTGGASTTPPAGQAPNVVPGPTLRARVGDLVQLTFLNLIDPLDFPGTDTDTLDETCDQTTKNVAASDTFPDCFNASVVTNVHYHGTHTNPNSTGDNVFLHVIPSPRAKDASRSPSVTAQTVQAAFSDVFKQCAAQLTPDNPTAQWPNEWSDVPESWQTLQTNLLKAFPVLQQRNDKLTQAGMWPQYFIGAYPYCFRLPNYTAATWPPAPQASLTAAQAAGHGSGHPQQQQTVQPLVMGQAPGTHWYHAHKHGSTTINVSNGMTGVFVIEGPYDDAINAFYGTNWTRSTNQKILVINQLGVTPNLLRVGGGIVGGQPAGPDFSVNGLPQPQITLAPNQVQMWRVANTSSRAGVYFLAPSGGVSWKVLARDGVQFNQTNYDASLNQPFLVESGSRADLLVKAPSQPGRYPVVVYNSVDPSDRLPGAKPVKLTLVTVNVTGAPATGNAARFMSPAPPFPPYLQDIADSEIQGTTNLLFASTPSVGTGPPPSLVAPAQHTINGKKFDGNVGVSVLLNQVEEWTVTNATFAAGPITPISHPFHIHINPFQITEIFEPGEQFTDPSSGATLPRYVFTQPTSPLQCQISPTDLRTWKPCAAVPRPSNVWRDVFSIPSGALLPNGPFKVTVPGYFKLRSRFVDFYGYYVLHCHILAHEDRGMMTVVQVAPVQSPYSHH